MKIKKLYAEPSMRLHKLTTSRIMAGSIPDNEFVDTNPGEIVEGDEGD